MRKNYDYHKHHNKRYLGNLRQQPRLADMECSDKARKWRGFQYKPESPHKRSLDYNR